MSKEDKRKFFNNGRLIVEKEKTEIFTLNNPQNLYLYPLNIIDYIDNITLNKPIFLNIIKTKDMDYTNLFNHVNFSNLKCVEILVDKNYDNVKRIISICNDKKIKVTLTINNLNDIADDFFIDVVNKVDFLKIFFYYNNYNEFINKIKLINKYKNDNLFILIKSYLSLEEIYNYQLYISDFINKVDVYQLSKKLLPIDKLNIEINQKYGNVIRKLEEKYSSRNTGLIFLSVKDLTTLYYPRFELDERNNRNCFACKLKPYLYEDIILPCRVNEIVTNKKKYGFKYDLSFNKFDGLGNDCSDCASIFENDLLGTISELDYDKYYLK